MKCAACNRSLSNPPVMIGGRSYGPVCAGRIVPRDKKPRARIISFRVQGEEDPRQLRLWGVM